MQKGKKNETVEKRGGQGFTMKQRKESGQKIKRERGREKRERGREKQRERERGGR